VESDLAIMCSCSAALSSMPCMLQAIDRDMLDNIYNEAIQLYIRYIYAYGILYHCAIANYFCVDLVGLKF
jgi:hypothetical protein